MYLREEWEDIVGTLNIIIQCSLNLQLVQKTREWQMFIKRINYESQTVRLTLVVRKLLGTLIRNRINSHLEAKKSPNHFKPTRTYKERLKIFFDAVIKMMKVILSIWCDELAFDKVLLNRAISKAKVQGRGQILITLIH